jgi:hypothetical protein
MLAMRQQKVWLGQLAIDREPRIDLHVMLPIDGLSKKTAILKDRLAYLLDTRFHPSPPEPERLTVEQVAETLNCRCGTVLRVIRRGKLHPIEENGEFYIDREEIGAIRYIPISDTLSRLIPRP